MLFICKTSHWTVSSKGIHLATVEQEREFFWAKVQVQQTFVDPSTRNHPSPVPFVFCVLTWTSQRLHSPLKCLVAHFSWFFFLLNQIVAYLFSPPAPHIVFIIFPTILRDPTIFSQFLQTVTYLPSSFDVHGDYWCVLFPNSVVCNPALRCTVPSPSFLFLVVETHSHLCFCFLNLSD